MPDHDALLAFLREHLERHCGGDIHVLRRSVNEAIAHLEEGTDTLYAMVVTWGEDAGPGYDGPTRWRVVESETGDGPVFATGTVTGFTGADDGQVKIARIVQEHDFELVGSFMYGIVPGSSVAMVRRIPRRR